MSIYVRVMKRYNCQLKILLRDIRTKVTKIIEFNGNTEELEIIFFFFQFIYSFERGQGWMNTRQMQKLENLSNDKLTRHPRLEDSETSYYTH